MMESQTQPLSSIEVQELELFVLEELKRQHLRDNIISALCKRANWDWKQAQYFLEKVYTDHHSELAPRENRLAFLVGFTTILDGLGVLALGSLGLLWYFFFNPRGGQPTIPVLDGQFILHLVMLLSIAPAYFMFFFIVAVTGIGIITRGVIGIILALGCSFRRQS
ncbi:MAG: hypothetical protein HY869_10090 [Chloroflexi bacterium]|nr:hypothetical protein [Chloroflexota bacterium]